ncbi:hypothetical protein [Streptomyces endophyticus]|uniref:Lipoprotein n=1 Tax=Streptomyces endophyticus TaxID=714166 RepID=A0ABU6F5X4_9ACTN|nr:hypothetical protein [Streptomyces endophyticus]MEB8339410.1 hypothetical protein [Streptomyces endophyticus]
MNNTHVLSASTARRAATALACAAALVSLTACGGGSDKAADADSKPSSATDKPAKADAKPNGVDKLTAVELRAKGTETKAAAGSVREVMSRSDAKSDLRVSATECTGTVDLKDMGTFDVVRKGNDVWGKVDSTFSTWAKKNGAGTIKADQWMHGSPTAALTKVLVSYCHGEQFGEPEKNSLKLTKGSAAEVAGQPVATVVAKGADPSRQATFSVATTGKPYLLQQETPYSNGTGMATITWSDFGTPVGAKAPTGKIVTAPKI